MNHATRLAPSPTGALHLGNARTFMVTWALARAQGWRIVLRIEDLDTPRVKAGAIEGAIEDLRWLGIDWDEGPIVQSRDLAPYAAAMDTLARAGHAYPCELTRGQIEAAASAPQSESAPADGPAGGEVVFPASLRPVVAAGPFTDLGSNWRFATPVQTVRWDDRIAGPQARRPCDQIGDFVLWTRRAQPSYQLAVVVDDHRQGITDVVRGDDLLDSAARQVLLYRALGYAPIPEYWHLPLVIGADGRRLAKRHGDTRVASYREAGVPPWRLVGLLAWWSGIVESRREVTAAEFAERFDPARLARAPVVFGAEDHAWLVQR